MFKEEKLPLECGVELVDIENEEQFEQLMLETCTMWLNEMYNRD